jgi:hypothetical protein
VAAIASAGLSVKKRPPSAQKREREMSFFRHTQRRKRHPKEKRNKQNKK